MYDIILITKPISFSILDISFRDNGAQKINCRQFVKTEESHYGVQIATRTTRFSILIDSSFFFLCNYISNRSIADRSFDRRTIHAANIPHCNVHACISTLTDVHNTSTKSRATTMRISLNIQPALVRCISGRCKE